MKSDIEPSVDNGANTSVGKSQGYVNEDHPFHQTYLGHQLLVVVDGHNDAGAVGQLMQYRFFPLSITFCKKNNRPIRALTTPMF